jgi:hypothetical protein
MIAPALKPGAVDILLVQIYAAGISARVCVEEVINRQPINMRR